MNQHFNPVKTMNSSLFTRSAAVLTLGLAALATPSVQARQVNVNFNVATDSDVAGFGEQFSGSFSYDDAIQPDEGIFGEDLYALTRFSFSFAGESYDLDDVPGSVIAFDPTSGVMLGLDAQGPVFTFVPGDGVFAASFRFDLGAQNAGGGDAFYRVDPGNVPEPATLGLLVAALAAAGAARRRAAR